MLNEELSPGSLNGLRGGFWGKFVKRMLRFSNSLPEGSTMGPKITNERSPGKVDSQAAVAAVWPLAGNAPWWENEWFSAGFSICWSLARNIRL